MKTLFTLTMILAVSIPVMAQDTVVPLEGVEEKVCLTKPRKVLRDLVYKTVGGEEVRLDIYYPAKQTADRPPVFYYTHGRPRHSPETASRPDHA